MSTDKNQLTDIFGKRLGAFMKDRRATQTGVAAHCQVAQSAVSGWLKGAMPGGAELVLLADYLQLKVEDLFHEQGAVITEALRESPAEYLIDDLIDEAQDIVEMAKRLESKARKLKTKPLSPDESAARLGSEAVRDVENPGVIYGRKKK